MTDTFVEAIEDGKLVRVTKDYAIIENLIIVKKRQNDLPFAAYPDEAREVKSQSRNEKTEPYYLSNNLMSELRENFHWELQRQRKMRNLTRKQLSNLSGISEATIAELESGKAPANFIALAKLETFYNVNVRK